MENRSQSQQQQTRRPPYPQQTPTQSAPTSPRTSAFQSASSVTSMASAASRHLPPIIQTQNGNLVSAPLPSPTSTQPTNYFGSLTQQSPTSHPSQQTQRERIPPQQNGQGQYLGQRGDGSGAPETAPFLKDFNLVAEAAKRAQMACLTRDLGDVGL